MQNRFRDWGDARFFLAVARLGSTLAAARETGVSQTTVARRIDALEHALGLCLFERDTRGYRLTPEGQALVPAAEALQAAAEAMEDAARAEHQRLSAPIRFTTWVEAMNAALAEIFAAFTASVPGVGFEFMASERPLDLMAGEADVALRAAAGPVDDALICRRVGQTNWTYYAADTYAADGGLPASMDDIDDHRIVLLRHIRSDRPDVRYCESESELLMLLLSGQGVGPMTVHQGDREPGLVRCFPPPPGSEIQILLLASPASYRRPEVRRFMAFAAPRFARSLRDAQESDA